jgi:hypothetical protein
MVSVKGREDLEELGTDGRITLKLILQTEVGKSNGFIWFSRQPGGGPL